MSKKTKKPTLVETWNTWTCSEWSMDMNFDEFKTHLKEVHQINETSGKKSMLMHLDGSKWFQSNYEWCSTSLSVLPALRRT